MVLIVVATVAMLLYISSASGEKSAKASFVGYRSFWEPTLLLRLRFCTQALPILTEGYQNVRAIGALPPLTPLASALFPVVSHIQSDGFVLVQE